MTATKLRALHLPGNPLLLPNAWDAASATLVEQAGFPAVATSSVAVAQSLGYEDHQGAPPAEMFDAVRRITRVVSVPVTVDAEGGYDLPATELAARLAEAGAVGCNIEDTDHQAGGLKETARHADYLSALRAAAPDLVLNARVDVFLRAEDPKAVLDDGLERATAYRTAGADCVYPITLKSPDLLKSFVDTVGPVNGNLMPGGPTLSTLAEIGIARVSMGGGLWHLVNRSTKRILRGLAAGISPYED
ncbi:isocitrate lyase/PEP mutase family protein [Actinocrispum wychmicini]|uniref:2-methylisocitrate lyase-like PEP mutase family enzyme n=1 Tax=Actinocrispum wychmicini TaxID=1213861 RepID=A0A4R2JF80_9PSEU|nr:isocitrate lyase/phosphoenolpyruvate mutase family protein [Actinocrispum wychmicini]TCO54919.1 2-methylisocitrate lyase-like PEP mutase family enzyme [Actinocrispum wychmicini]